MNQQLSKDKQKNVIVRTLQESDLPQARAICSIAFGTFMGVPNPESFSADRDYVGTRWRADPGAAFAAELDGALAGSNIAANWGSFAFFGPLTVSPQFWGRGIAQALLAPTIDLFDRWGAKNTALFTFAHSPKHIGLYQKFGFWPGFLTAVMSKSVGEPPSVPSFRFSSASPEQRDDFVKACRNLTNSILDGLDVSLEIRSVFDQQLGDTILLGGDSLDAFAVCHCGEGTEAGANTCYLKFAAVRPGPDARRNFEHLLNACESLAAARGLKRLEAGVNVGRRQAYRTMLARGFRTEFQGVAMHRPDSLAYNRPDVFVIDDLR